MISPSKPPLLSMAMMTPVSGVCPNRYRSQVDGSGDLWSAQLWGIAFQTSDDFYQSIPIEGPFRDTVSCHGVEVPNEAVGSMMGCPGALCTARYPLCI